MEARGEWQQASGGETGIHSDMPPPTCVFLRMATCADGSNRDTARGNLCGDLGVYLLAEDQTTEDDISQVIHCPKAPYPSEVNTVLLLSRRTL